MEDLAGGEGVGGGAMEAIPDPDDGPSMLDVLEGMSAHFHEHHSDIVRWPWKLFCAKWVRLITASTRDWEERQRDEEAREERERRQRIQAFASGAMY